jgi:hypothetical protein
LDVRDCVKGIARSKLPASDACFDHRPLAGLPQPHWQFRSWQRHSFFWQPQEQLPHSQFAFLAVLVAVFFTLDMVFSPFLCSAYALSKRLTDVPSKHYSRACVVA